MSKKVNLFDASKEMSERVAQFMRVKVWNVTLKARLEKTVKDCEAKIETLKEIGPSVGKDFSEEITTLSGLVDQAKKDYDKALKEAEKFEYTDNDKTFYKLYADSDKDTIKAIIHWFEKYNLEVDEDTNIVLDIFSAISGARKLGGRQIVRANAEKFTDDVRTKTDVLTIFYGRLAEAMMQAGTLKPEAIPEDVREFYAPKKNSKKAKKGQIVIQAIALKPVEESAEATEEVKPVATIK